jgi:hypothetical protein
MKVGNGSNYQNTPFQTNISIDKIPSLDFNIEHISQDEYYNLVVNDNIDKNTLYILSSDNLNLYNEQIKNLGEPTDDTDATNKKYVDNLSVEIIERINDIKIPENISELSNDVGFSKITIDNKNSENLNIVHISQDKYHELVVNENIDNTSLYIVSSDSLNVYNERITNLADGISANDAVNLNQLCSAISSIYIPEIPTKVSVFENDANYTKISVDNNSTTEFGIEHISQDEYHKIVVDKTIDNNKLYIVSSDNINAYGEKIINVAEPENENDATNKKYVDEKLSEIDFKSSVYIGD